MFGQDAIAKFLGSWSAELNFTSVVLRMALAVVMGAIIGCERSSKRHSAGLRTFILVAMAATTAMLIDQVLFTSADVHLPVISASAVISVALISGNSILFSSRNQIKGLTTSAGLWACGVIGLAAGAGMYTVTLAAFVAMLAIISLFPALERFLKDKSNHFEVHLELTNRSNLQEFVTTIRRLGIRIDDIESNPAYLNSGLSVYSVSLTILSRELKKYKRHDEIIQAMRSLDYVYHIEEMN